MHSALMRSSVMRWLQSKYLPSPVVVEHDVWPAAFCDALADAILANPLLDNNTLMGSFAATRGFAVSCHRDQVERAKTEVPVLSTFLDAAVAHDASLQHNAYFANALVMPSGTGVARHQDATLADASEPDHAVPDDVIVTYLRIPRGAGALVIDDGARRTWRIEPKVGMRVRFRGHLAHRIEAGVASGIAGDEMRVSVVVERYALDTVQLARLPLCQIHSRAMRPNIANAAAPTSKRDFGEVLHQLRREYGA